MSAASAMLISASVAFADARLCRFGRSGVPEQDSSENVQQPALLHVWDCIQALHAATFSVSSDLASITKSALYAGIIIQLCTGRADGSHIPADIDFLYTAVLTDPYKLDLCKSNMALSDSVSTHRLPGDHLTHSRACRQTWRS
jgi:hypothetical protein